MNKPEVEDIKIKILKGIDIAGKKLIEDKIREDGDVVISRDGKIMIIKAKDLLENK